MIVASTWLCVPAGPNRPSPSWRMGASSNSLLAPIQRCLRMRRLPRALAMAKSRCAHPAKGWAFPPPPLTPPQSRRLCRP
eukprot:scaffold5834_cov107-Isochrysis_galbana.AAC.7